MSNSKGLVLGVTVAIVLLTTLAVFAVLLLLQRRRRRTQMLVALAAEQAERRRKKRKRIGLRSAEIDKFCPELLVVPPGTLSRAASDDDDSDGDDAPSAGSRAGEDKLVSREARESTAADDAPTGAPHARALAGALAPIEIADGCETCVVCLDEMVVDERVRRLPCAHIYHSACIRVWLRRKNACPCCCKTVVKRRKKPRVHLDPTLPPSHNLLEEPPGLPELPVEPPPRAASLDLMRSQMRRTCSTPHVLQSSMSMPIVDPDVTGSYVIDMEILRMRSTDNDRPRPPLESAFSRIGSLLDPDDSTSDVMQSEASSRFDESMASDLLEQVRQVLRDDDESGADGGISDSYTEYNEDEDSAVFQDNLQLNRPFRGHASPIGLPSADGERRHVRFRD